MNPEDVAHHVCKSFDDFAARATKREAPNNWDGLRDELCKWVFSVETDVAFDGLLHILETRTRYQCQWLAGDLLPRASVPCRIDLDEFIARALTQSPRRCPSILPNRSVNAASWIHCVSFAPEKPMPVAAPDLTRRAIGWGSIQITRNGG
jgi:hypothetical protein